MQIKIPHGVESEVKIMFPNLNAELSRYNIDVKAFALIIDSSEKTARNKLNGITDFTLPEIRKVAARFPAYTIEYLFATEISA